jgi:hypothetical protein
MGLLDTNYQDQRLTASQKKKIKPAVQGGGYNYLGEQEEVTVPKKWLSDPDHVVAELAYITPREKKVLIDLNMYGSLDGKPNNAPGGLPSLQGDMGSVGGDGGNSGGGGDGNRESYGGGGQYGGTTDTSTDTSDGGGFERPTIADVTGTELPGTYGAVDPDPEIDTPTSERQDTITSFSKNLQANIKSNPFSVLTPTSTLAKTALQTLAANAMLGNLGFGSIGGDTDTDGFGGDGNGGLTREQVNQLTPYAPYLMSDTIAPESMVSEYFSNMPLNSISSNLQTDYNNAKNNISSILGVTPLSQQFGYSTQPYGSLNNTNLMNNILNIDYLRTQGLI